jgi:DNA end-binding protein Ku
LRGREYIVSLKACGAGLILETLRYDEELHKAASYFQGIGKSKPDPDLLALASDLIEKKTGSFDASDYENRYIDALKELIDRKLKAKGGKVEPEEEEERPSGGNVIDLMAALKSSLDGKGESSAEKKSPAKKPPPKKLVPKKTAARKRA